MELTDEIVRELKSKYGPKLFAFETELGTIVLRPPSRAEFDRFVDESNGDAGKAAAMGNYVASCIVFPDPKAVSAMLDAQPGFIPQLSAKIHELAGNSDKSLKGKAL